MNFVVLWDVTQRRLEAYDVALYTYTRRLLYVVSRHSKLLSFLLRCRVHTTIPRFLQFRHHTQSHGSTRAQLTRHNIPEDDRIQINRSGSLRYRRFSFFYIIFIFDLVRCSVKNSKAVQVPYPARHCWCARLCPFVMYVRDQRKKRTSGETSIREACFVLTFRLR